MRNQVINLITSSSGKMYHNCLSKKWWEKRNSELLYNFVFETTNFLSNNSSFRERLFYIQNGWYKLQLCKYCNLIPKIFLKNKLKLSDRCSSYECSLLHKSEISKIVLQNMSEETKRKKAHACSISNKGDWETKFGKIKSDKLKEKCRVNNLGKSHSEETKKKMSLSRTGKIKSNETRKKISETNKLTHNSVSYKLKCQETHKNVGQKLSKILKEKIKNGEFTPNITNSWTRRNIEVQINGIKTKYRSSWEAAFAMLNPIFQYEKIRIPYKINGEIKTYIVDFADFENKKLFEIKPDTMKNSIICNEKEKFAREWGEKNGWTFEYISNDWFSKNIDKLQLLDFPYINLLRKGINAKKII